MQDLELNEELLNDILEYLIIKKYSYNTTRVYSSSLKRLFEKYDRLDRETINKLLKKFKHGNEKAIITLINDYCAFMNIDFRVNMPRMKRQKSKRTIKTLPMAEIELMIKSVPKPYDLSIKCIYWIGGGLRISEVIRLSWNHFKWAHWLQEKKMGAVEIKDSKSDDRLCTVPEKLMHELYNYAREKRVINEFGIPVGGLLFIFAKDYNPKLRTNNLDLWKHKYIRASYDWFRHNIIKNCCEKALGHRINIHALRHTRATELVNNEIPLDVVQNLLGHKDLRTTMIYVEVSNKRVFNAMKEIE